MPDLNCIVVTPERTVLEKPADFVALSLYDGEIGIAPGHTPLVGRLGAGEMRILSAGRTERYYVEGGFVEVLDNVVSVLTQRAIPAAELDREAAREHLDQARARPGTTPEEFAVRDRLVEQSRAQLRVAGRAG